MKSDYDYKKYDEYLYTGAQGFAMRMSHKLLNSGVDPKYNANILDIGGGSMPHNSIVELKENETYCLSDVSSLLTQEKQSQLLKKYKHYTFHLWDDDMEFEQFQSAGIRFTRVVASHVWEHVRDPEEALLKWHSLLADDGILTIAIPCDPGLAWRTGQLISRSKAKNILGIDAREYDLQMTREHVNPAQNLIKIFKYYAPEGNIKLFPFRVPLVEFNLFCILNAKKTDFIDV